MSYNPLNWYWHKQDGQLYSSVKQAYIPETDEGYIAFLLEGNRPSQFPRDVEGRDDENELREYLANFGLRMFPPTPEEEQQAIQRQLTSFVQQHLDNWAQERNYDNIQTLCNYANDYEPNEKFKAEGKQGILSRSQTWSKCYEIMNAVLAGERDVPTLEELAAELPPLVWSK